jgi:hypothetical protein
MELKDVILSTLAEIDDTEKVSASEVIDTQKVEILQELQSDMQNMQEAVVENRSGSEKLFLQTMQERLLVLFEGFQSPNNVQIEAKVDLTLNFLEYLLAMIENRLKEIERQEE